MRGRKPKPSHIRIVGGKAGHRPINTAEPTFCDHLPEPPAYLTTRAREIFLELRTSIDEMGYASASHVKALSLCAVALEQVEVCTRVIEEQGLTYKTENNFGDELWKERPEAKLRLLAMKQAQSLLSDFGLNPTASTRIVVPGKQKKNAFAGL